MELDEGVYAAEKIVQQRTRKGKKEYLVKWVGCTPDQNTWEPAKNIYDKRLIAAFDQNQQTSPVKRGRKPKQVPAPPQHHERQVLPFGGSRNRVASSSSSSSCSSSDDEAENDKKDRSRRSKSTSASSDEGSSTSSSSEDEEDASESEEEKQPKKSSASSSRTKPIVRPGKAKEPAAKKSASLSNSGNAASSSGGRVTSSPLKEKSPFRESLKRKAEVIQESGKIGVTITTTPKTSPTAPGAGGAMSAFGQEANILEAASNLLSMKHGTPAVPPPAKVVRTGSNASAGKPNRPQRAAATANVNGISHGLQNGKIHTHDKEPDALPAEYWMTKQPLADQIVLTDVTVSAVTITVRECKTGDEFFKNGPSGLMAIEDLKKPQPVNAANSKK